MDAARLAREHQPDAYLPGNESSQNETSRLKCDHGGDLHLSEWLSEGRAGCAEQGRVAEHSGEVCVSVRPAKGAEEQRSS